MPSKYSAVLIAVFLLTVFVLVGGTNSAPGPAPVTPEASGIAAGTPESTAEATVEVTESATEMATAEATAASTETALVGDPVRGKMIFENGLYSAPACKNCHVVTGKTPAFGLAPSLAGISTRAAQRIPGMTAPQYIEDSIRKPSDYIVPGFHVNMYPDFGKDYSDHDIADLVAYLMTL